MSVLASNPFFIKIKLNMKIKGTLEIKPNGSGFLINGDEKIYIYKKNTGIGLDQDTVEIELIDGKIEGSKEGKVVSIIERNRTQFTGILHKVKDFGFLIIDSKRIPHDFFIRPEQAKKYKEGEKLLVEIGNWKEGNKPTCKVIRSLGMVGENDAEIESILYEYNLNPNFPDTVELESEAIDWNITDSEISKRKDFRNVTTFTIDPETAKDFDDAISIRKINDIYEIGIHIADVSHYVIPDSELDKEAFKRATSVYLVDRVIPMIPERLSNGVCSLRPNEDKLTYSVVINIDLQGNLKNTWIGRTIMHSNRRYSYEEAQAVIEGGTDTFENEIRILNTISQNLRKKRNSLLFDRAEVKFDLDHEFHPIGVTTKESNESHQLIEELMLMANKIIGKYLHDNGMGIYRVHDTPNEEKLGELKIIAEKCGFSFDIKDIRESLNKLGREISGTPYENLIQTLSIRSMSKAEYSIGNLGHYGLDFDYYTHFTSPIRRYPDLISHRLVTNYLDSKNVGNPVIYEEKCDHCNKMEQNAKRAERDSIRFKQVQYMLERVGKSFTGIITGVSDWGIYVELEESKCEGLILKDDVQGVLDTNNFQALLDNGRKITLGDSVMITVKKVSLMKKEIDFILF